MVDLKKILRKAFDKDSLENENWLEPSATMLEEIEGRIYTKKKGRVWFFLVPVLLVLLSTVIGICLGTSKIDGHSASPTKTKIDEKQTSKKQINSEVNNPNTNLGENKSLILNETAIKNPIISVKNNLPKALTASAFQKRDFSFNPSFSSNTEVISFTRFSNQNKTIAKSKNILDKSMVEKEEKALKENLELEIIPGKSSQLTMLGSLGLPNVSTKKGMPKVLPVEVILPKKSSWSMVVGTNASLWQFKLNDAFISAVSPADFQSSNGLGTRTYIGMDRKLGRRISIGAKLAYEQIGFSSGHNSIVAYDRNAETDANFSNTKNIKMATPVGFIDSDVTINRDSDLAGSEVLIDIKNQHKIQSLDLQLNLDYQLPMVFGLRPNISLGAGVQYIAKLTNELKYFTPQQNEFSEGEGAIVAGQTSLNRWSPMVSSGFGLEKYLTKNLSIGLNGNYLFNLTNIQEGDQLSTRVNRFNGGIYLRRNF